MSVGIAPWWQSGPSHVAPDAKMTRAATIDEEVGAARDGETVVRLTAATVRPSGFGACEGSLSARLSGPAAPSGAGLNQCEGEAADDGSVS